MSQASNRPRALRISTSYTCATAWRVVQTIQVQCLSHTLVDSSMQRASETCDQKPNQVTQEILTPRLEKRNLSHHHPAFPLVVKIT